eukprot:gene19627-biopygen6205
MSIPREARDRQNVRNTGAALRENKKHKVDMKLGGHVSEGLAVGGGPDPGNERLSHHQHDPVCFDSNRGHSILVGRLPRGAVGIVRVANPLWRLPCESKLFEIELGVCGWIPGAESEGDVASCDGLGMMLRKQTERDISRCGKGGVQLYPRKCCHMGSALTSIPARFRSRTLSS